MAGFTVVEPVAEVEVNVPGVIAIDAAPVVFHESVLLAPDWMLVGLALNDVIDGFLTVTVAMRVTEPAELVAVRV